MARKASQSNSQAKPADLERQAETPPESHDESALLRRREIIPYLSFEGFQSWIASGEPSQNCVQFSDSIFEIHHSIKREVLNRVVQQVVLMKQDARSHPWSKSFVIEPFGEIELRFGEIEDKIRRTFRLKQISEYEYKQLDNIRDMLSVATENAIFDIILTSEDYITDDGSAVKPGKSDLDLRIRVFEMAVLETRGEGAGELLRKMFPELSESNAVGQPSSATALEQSDQLPTTAPALWASDKQRGDTPPEFIKRHYGPWLGKGLTRPDVKRLDPQLYTALSNWLRHNEIPADLDLPTLKEKNDRWVAKIEAEGRPNMGALTAKEASNLRNVMSRRGRAGSENIK
jgi:hypothetical protein